MEPWISVVFKRHSSAVNWLCFCSLHRCGLLKNQNQCITFRYVGPLPLIRSGGGGGRVQAKGVEDVLLWVADSNVFFFSDGLQVFSTHLITKKQRQLSISKLVLQCFFLRHLSVCDEFKSVQYDSNLWCDYPNGL